MQIPSYETGRCTTLEYFIDSLPSFFFPSQGQTFLFFSFRLPPFFPASLLVPSQLQKFFSYLYFVSFFFLLFHFSFFFLFLVLRNEECFSELGFEKIKKRELNLDQFKHVQVKKYISSSMRFLLFFPPSLFMRKVKKMKQDVC